MKDRELNLRLIVMLAAFRLPFDSLFLGSLGLCEQIQQNGQTPVLVNEFKLSRKMNWRGVFPSEFYYLQRVTQPRGLFSK